jgi:hypothetical protein
MNLSKIISHTPTDVSHTLWESSEPWFRTAGSGLSIMYDLKKYSAVNIPELMGHKLILQNPDLILDGLKALRCAGPVIWATL